MKAGIISPIPLLSRYSANTDYHVCNPILLWESVEYLDFYKEMKARGDYVILDSSSGSPRQSVKMDILLEVLEKLSPSLVVAPDRELNAPRTIQSTMEFLEETKSLVKERNIGVLGMVQGATLEQCLLSYRAVYKFVDAIGLPRSVESAFGRSKFIKRTRMSKPVHIFGIHTKPEEEVENLLDLDKDNIVGITCDLPIRLGFACRLLDETKPEPPQLDMYSNYDPFPDFTFKNAEEFILNVEGE